ncbi:ATPase family protein [Listeria seeligeri FSL S4-171]|uniref:hypothetical protein n=1 Tax=Listeria seeligeri TaxID=1640 RepID=UPI0001EB7173|nr:hypothetical protein [Listeria seeligeri]EFS03985.1 ATPase family protein [Listeria seeligeri FSL S4-171]
MKQQSGLLLLEVANATSELNQKIMDTLFTQPKTGSITALSDKGTFKLIIKIPAIHDK